MSEDRMDKMISLVATVVAESNNTKEYAKETRTDVKEMGKLFTQKVVEDEVKFTERPTKKEIRKVVVKYVSIGLVILGLLISTFFGATKLGAYWEDRHNNVVIEDVIE